MSKDIQKNCIIVGPLDSYCLFCEYCLKTQESILQHIQTTLHQDRFKSIPYFEQYKDDGIRRFKSGYYCEFCSVLVKTKKKIALHITEGSHANSKTVRTLQEVENGVVALNNIFIEDKAWHGVMDNTCFICNIDVTNENDHVKDPSHIFTLIQSKLDCIENNIFRTVDNDFINCLICNIIIKSSTFMVHIKNESHLTQLMKCKKGYITSVNSTAAKPNNIGYDSKNNTNNANEEFKRIEHQLNEEEIDSCNKKERIDVSTTEKKNEKSLTKKINHEHIEDINKDKKDEKAKDNVEASNDLKTTNDNNIKVEYEESSVVETNLGSGSDSMVNTKIFEPCEAMQIAQEFSKKHKIKYSFGKHSAYCKACNVTISSSLQRMKDHVAQNEHKENFSKMFVLGKEPFANFLNNCFKQIVLNGLERVVVLNNKICISYASFLMITSNQYAKRCQICQTSDNLYPYELHEKSRRHKTLSSNTILVVVFTSEFIRMVRGCLYHCGFCNLLMSWSDLLDHLSSISHKINKDLYSSLLLHNITP